MINAFAAISVMFLWALCYPMITIGLEYSPPLLFAAIRAIISGMFLLILARLMNRKPIRTGTNWISIILIGLTATSLGFWGMFHAASLVSPGLATVVTNAQPLIAVLLAWGFLSEKPGGVAMFGIIVGFVGIILISADSIVFGSSGLRTGLAYILVAASGVAISNIILKKVAGKVDGFYAMGWQLVIGSVPLAAMSYFLEYPQQIELTQAFILSLFIVSIFGTSLVFVLWFWLLKRMPLYRANAYSFLTPVLGLLIGVKWYSESLGSIQLVGIVAVILGIFLVNYKPKAVIANIPAN